MDLIKLLHFLTVLSLAVVASHADLDVYWKSKLPNTPMPKAVRDLLNSESLDYKSSSILVGTDGIDANPYTYSTVATPEELEKYASRKVVIYFFEKELHPGTSMNLQFHKSANTAAFLPRKFADSIPFSSKHLSEILNKFSVTSDSAEGKVIKRTITECERPALKGEYKYCTTSFESLTDFGTSKLGKNPKAFTTEAQTDKKPQQYSIVSVSELKNNGKAAVCHKRIYPYAVFNCHILHTSEAYMVSLVGADGAKAKALAICHIDTAEWNPKELAFQVLKVKPGTVPICHFLPVDTILWVPK